MSDLRELRRELRARRLKLPDTLQRHHGTQIGSLLGSTLPFARARRIAGYLPNDGEIDPLPLLLRAAAMGKECYLPVLHPVRHNSLWFCAWLPGDPLHVNRFGIEEPAHIKRRSAAWSLDIILLPLVGFDRDGHRLGMGGGFYDRTLAFRRRHRNGPLLIGLAHSCQEVERIERQRWDVPLDAIVTEREVITLRAGIRRHT